MKRLLAGGAVLVMLLGAGMQPAAAAPDAHTVGTYTLHQFWNQAGPVTTTLLIEGRGRAQTLDGDSGSWSLVKGTGHITITLAHDGVTSTLSGVKGSYGMSKPKSPGTMTNTSSDSGTWYAKRTP